MREDKYLDLARERKNQWNMKGMVIPIVGGALGTVHKGLEKKLGKPEIRERIQAIQTIPLFKSAIILVKVLEK